MHKKGLVLVFTTAVISGFSIFINKYGVSVVNPYIFTFLKNALVALMICGILLAAKDWRVLKLLTKKQWFLLVTIGLIGGSIPFLLFFKGLSLTSAAQGAFIHKTMFVYVLVLAAVFLKEKIGKSFLIGALMLLLGNLTALKILPTSLGRGDLLVFLATILWAIENVISKYTLKDLPGKTVAWGRMFFGSVFILGWLAATGQISLVGQLNIGQIGWTAMTAVILFGYVMTWYSGLKYVPASAATAILMFGSPITTLLSLVSGVGVRPKEMISGVLIMAGLIIILGAKRILERKRIKQLKFANAK